VEVFRGVIDGYQGKIIDYREFTAPVGQKPVTKISKEAEEEIHFGYCTEFIVLLEHPLEDVQIHEFKSFLNSIGDSIVLVADDEIVKVHVHTNHPGQAFEKGLTYGALSRMKVDNMREEHQEKLIKDAERIAREQAEADKKSEAANQNLKPVGFISVSVGDGLSDIFKDLGVDYLIEGGQTMNPSTQDMLEAIRQVPAQTIFIFPNNTNIILAANQARDMTEDKRICVIPSKTIPQGITAMISYVPELSAQENERNMLLSLDTVKTGQITYAVRDTRLNEKEIHEGDFMGIGDHGIMAVGTDITKTAIDTVSYMVDENSEVISIYYGAGIEEQEAEALQDSLSEQYPDCEVELNPGGQPVYYYIISVE
jgi:hypothetical protein